MGEVPLIPAMRPRSGVAGNTGIKYEKRRPDMDARKFDALIEQKGYRLAWSRATECPCSSVNDQTRQPDPNCLVCKGTGWLYFAPTEPVMASKVGKLNPLQEKLIADTKSGVIRGIITGIRSNREPFGEIGNWQWGDVTVSVRPENRLGHYDKLIHLDSEIVFVEAFDTDDPALPIKTRYLVNQINMLRSLATEFVAGTDFTLTAGAVTWLPGKGPIKGTRVSLHYLTHPTWLIIDHPHAIRASMRKLKVKDPLTPQGDPQNLPIQAHARLDFLP
jgi:hypothetical protein